MVCRKCLTHVWQVYGAGWWDPVFGGRCPATTEEGRGGLMNRRYHVPQTELETYINDTEEEEDA